MKLKLTAIVLFLSAFANVGLALCVTRDSRSVDAETLRQIRAGDNKVCATCFTAGCNSACSTCNATGDGLTWNRYTNVNFNDGYFISPTATTQINRIVTLCRTTAISYYSDSSCNYEVMAEQNYNINDAYLACSPSGWFVSCAGLTAATVCP